MDGRPNRKTMNKAAFSNFVTVWTLPYTDLPIFDHSSLPLREVHE